jgi:hypothetical protein
MKDRPSWNQITDRDGMATLAVGAKVAIRVKVVGSVIVAMELGVGLEDLIVPLNS